MRLGPGEDREGWICNEVKGDDRGGQFSAG